MNMEERHLAEADRHIAEAEKRIAEQERRLAELTALHHDTREAERLLGNLRATLKELYVHRQMIIEAIARR